MRRKWIAAAELLPWLAAVAALGAAGYAVARGSGTAAKAAPTAPAVSTAPERIATKRPPTRRTATARPVLVVRATRGDCWVDARAGSATGPRLFYGLLRHGRTLRLGKQSVWVELGAAANVDVIAAGKKEAIPRGTITRLYRLRSP